MSEIHQMSLREIQVKIEKEIKSIQYQLKISDFNSALQFATEIKNKYTSPEEKSVLEKVKFDSLHNKIIAHKLDSEFAIIEEKLIKELKIPKIDKADGFVADMKALLNKIIANGTNIEKYQKRIDDFKAEINKIAKLNPHLQPIPKPETSVEINQATEFSDQIQAKRKPKKTPKTTTNIAAHTIIDRPPSTIKEEIKQNLSDTSPDPIPSPPTSPLPTAPPPIIPPATKPVPLPTSPPQASPAQAPPSAPPLSKPTPPPAAPPPNIVPASPISKAQIHPRPKPQAMPKTSPPPFQPDMGAPTNTELISATEISSFKLELNDNSDDQAAPPAKPPESKSSNDTTTQIISTPPKHTIPSSIQILIENAGYTALTIKPRNPLLGDLFTSFQAYSKCTNSNHESHHHFLFVKYTYNNYSISTSPEYVCSPREEQLPESEKVQLKESKVQMDLYQPFSITKRWIDEYYKAMTEADSTDSKNTESVLSAIRELYNLLYPANRLSIQRSPIFLRFASRPLTINFSTLIIFPKATIFQQKIPGIPSKYGIFYGNDESLPFYLDYFNSKYGILNNKHQEHINKTIIPQADKDFYDGMIKSGIFLTLISIIAGVAWVLGWDLLALIGFVLWIGLGGNIFRKKRAQFAITYNKHHDGHFYSNLKFTPDQITAICKHFIVSQQKELFRAEYTYTQTIKAKSPNIPLINTKPQKATVTAIHPPSSPPSNTEELFGNLGDFFD
jgi:hypothetical protein